jgi:hypothetical protein
LSIARPAMRRPDTAFVIADQQILQIRSCGGCRPAARSTAAALGASGSMIRAALILLALLPRFVAPSLPLLGPPCSHAPAKSATRLRSPVHNDGRALSSPTIPSASAGWGGTVSRRRARSATRRWRAGSACFARMAPAPSGRSGRLRTLARLSPSAFSYQ